MKKIKRVFRRVQEMLVRIFIRPFPVIFDHIPKCGGTTINLYLRKNYRSDRVYSIDGYHPSDSVAAFLSLSDHVRNKYLLIQGHLAARLFEAVDPNAIRVTVVRDPIERVVSHYYYALRNARHYLNDKLHTGGTMSLEDYCSSGVSVEVQNWYVRHFSKSDTNVELTDEHVEAAYQNLLENYDLIGFQDDIKPFMLQLRTLAGYRIKFVNNYKNSSGERLTVREISDEASRCLRKFNALDVLLYDRLLAIRDNGIIHTHRRGAAK